MNKQPMNNCNCLTWTLMFACCFSEHGEACFNAYFYKFSNIWNNPRLLALLWLNWQQKMCHHLDMTNIFIRFLQLSSTNQMRRQREDTSAHITQVGGICLIGNQCALSLDQSERSWSTLCVSDRTKNGSTRHAKQIQFHWSNCLIELIHE